MFLNRLLRGMTGARPAGEPAAASGGWWNPFLVSGYAKLRSDTEPGSAEESLRFHPWFRAISLIAQKCASVPRHLYAPAGNSKKRDPSHWVHQLVNGEVNEEQSAFQFWLQMGGHVPSRGNGYAAIYRAGDQTELLPLDPDSTYPVRKDGMLWYLAFPFGHDGDGFKMRPAEVLHFRGFGFDGLVGYPVWEVAKEEIGLGRAQRQLEKSRYNNDGRPSMVLQTDSRLDDKAKTRIAEDWTKLHVGIDKAFRTAVLDQGLKATPIGFDAEALGQDAATQMSIVAISNLTGVPKSKLGAGGQSYQSQEQEDQAFISDCLDFYVNVFDDETGKKLLTKAERKLGYEVKGNREALLRASRKDKFETIMKATGGKPIMTQNEGRKLIDLPESDEEGANELRTPLNFGQGGSDNAPANPNDPGPGRPAEQATRRGARAVIEYTAARLVRRAGAQAQRTAARPDEFLAWVDALRAKESAAFAAEIAPCVTLAVAIAPGVPTQAKASGHLLDCIHGRYADLAARTSSNKLAESVATESAEQERLLPKTVADRLLGEIK